MTTNTLHGITSNTPKEFLIDAGVLVRNFVPGTTTLANANIIGVTDGGVTAKVAAEIHSPSIDGAFAAVKGTERITKYDVSLEGTIKTVNVESITDALVGSSHGTLTENSAYWDITPGLMSAGDYYDNVALMVTHSSDPTLVPGAVFMVLNARSDGSLEAATKHGDEAGLKFKYEGTVTTTDPQGAPYRILLPKVAGEVS